MEIIKDWPYKWFGVWSEYGEGFENYPSIKEFMNPAIVGEYLLKDLDYYLSNCQIVATTSGSVFPDPKDGKVIKESISYRTDGEWLWIDSLPYYIKKYEVAIPEKFLRNITKNKYIPTKWEGNFDDLDWPF